MRRSATVDSGADRGATQRRRDGRSSAADPAPPTHTRTPEQIAARIGFRPEFVAAILEDEVKRGHVERASGGYRLTAHGAKQLGALRFLAPGRDG